MSRFKERLWRDLMREHGSELAQIRRPAAGRARHARPRLLAGTTVALAGIGTALVLFLSAASTPAAFAVTGNSDGTVSVVLKQIAGIKGANQKLAALGVRAKFVEVLPGCRAPLPAAAVAGLKTPRQVLIHATRETRIDPREIPRGRMLVIVSWMKAQHVHVAKLGAAVHAAPDCIHGPPPRALRMALTIAHACRIAVKVPPAAHVLARPDKRWTITRDGGKVAKHSGAPAGNSGPFTGNSGAPTGNSGPGTAHVVMPPERIKPGKGCPRPQAVPRTAPGTGNSGGMANGGAGGSSGTTGDSATTGNNGTTGNSG